MRAAILAVGTELLGTDRLDTNSLLLTESLARHGFELARKAVVGDDADAIVRELEWSSADAELLLVTGGLGPTRDDLTREALARFAGSRLELDAGELARLQERYRRLGRTMPPSNRRQAEVVVGARVLANPVGTAPGLHLRVRDSDLFSFPGVPRELRVMVERELEPWLEAHAGTERSGYIELVTACVPESEIEDRLGPAYEALGREAIAVLARPGEVRVRVSARCAQDVLATELERRRLLVAPLLRDALYSEHGEDLEQAVCELLRVGVATVAVAESCTGGLVGERITRVAGSSDVFVGGAIVYSNRLKVDLLGVAQGSLFAHGAVSERVAREMAVGARMRFQATYALAITGVAGPGGGTAEKPVGTVHLALAGPQGVDHLQVRLRGDRERVRWQASQLALDMVRRRLLGLPMEAFWFVSDSAKGAGEPGGSEAEHRAVEAPGSSSNAAPEARSRR
ncbi:MAG TPA: CinA family nicotinamide mononucleotide deamidase-related protein [Thermoanaerobaculia bacterium]|nr:CinA family nicotinamide mononucleotide deamidase-related protein [Thermoanaerobaculia bacterium]